MSTVLDRRVFLKEIEDYASRFRPVDSAEAMRSRREFQERLIADLERQLTVANDDERTDVEIEILRARRAVLHIDDQLAALPAPVAEDESADQPVNAFVLPDGSIDRSALHEDAKCRHLEWKERGFAAWCRKNGFPDKVFRQWLRRDERSEKPGALRYPDESPTAVKIVSALQKMG